MKTKAVLMVLALLSGTLADGALIPRLGGQVVYDTVDNMTWLADAGFAGRMNQAEADKFIAGLNAENYLGANDWRVPSFRDIGSGGCASVWVFQQPCTNTEFGELYFTELGAIVPFLDVTSMHGATIHSDMTGNHGPFKNIQSGYLYYNPGDYPFAFSMVSGFHESLASDQQQAYIWPVHDGDTGAVPEPRGIWLLCVPALIAYYWVRVLHAPARRAPSSWRTVSAKSDSCPW